MSVTTSAKRLTVFPAIPAETAHALLRWLPLALICTLPVVFYAPFFTEPFFRDEGSYAAVAQWMLDGHVPYENAFDNKPPMVYAYYAVSFLLFGENVVAPRLLVALLISGATALMYVEGRMLYSHRGGLVAAFFFAMSFGVGSVQTSANTEFFMIPAATASLVAFTAARRNQQPGWYAAAGLFSGVAMATKPISLFIFVLYALVLVADRVHGTADQRRGLARNLALLAGGLAITGAAVVVPFALTGALPDLYEATIVYALVYVGDIPLSDKIDAVREAARHFLFVTGPWNLFALLGAFYIVRRGADGWGPLIVGFFFANLIGIAVAGRFYAHYFIAMLPAMSLLAPLGARVARDVLSSNVAKVIVAGFLPFLLVIPLLNSVAVYGHTSVEDRHEAKYYGDARAPWENRGPEFGEWLKARTEPGDGLWNFGFQSEIYFYSDLRSPTRFFMDRPFWNSDEYMNQALTELEADKPLYVLDSATYENWTGIKIYRIEVRQWIEANYDYLGRFYYADVFRLKGASS